MICRTAIEQSDLDASRMQAKLDYIPIDQLVTYIGKKVPTIYLKLIPSLQTTYDE